MHTELNPLWNNKKTLKRRLILAELVEQLIPWNSSRSNFVAFTISKRRCKRYSTNQLLKAIQSSIDHLMRHVGDNVITFVIMEKIE